MSADQWKNNTACSAEEQILLEVIVAIEKNTKDIEQGKITMCTDNKRLKSMLMKQKQKVNDFFQDAGAIIGTMQMTMKKMKLTLVIEHAKGHPKKPSSFEKDPVSWTMVECNNKFKEARTQREKNERHNSILKKETYTKVIYDRIKHNSINELARKEYATKKEREYMQRKFSDLWRCIDIEARNVFKGGVKSGCIKSAHGHNNYRVRDNLINKSKINTCPRCIGVETWDHVMQCASARTLRCEYLKNMREMLMITKKSEEKIREINDMISDLKKYLEGK